jgi:predicted Ser/Thr protein kinase
MLDPVSTIQNIYAVATLVYNQIQLVQANKQQCKRLGERVKIIEAAVRGLEKIKDKAQYQLGLNDLLNSLKEVLEFIKKFTTSYRWERWVLKAGNYRDVFTELNGKLQESLLQLNLGLAAQQIVNREADAEDQVKDTAFIQDSQSLIVELNLQALKALQSTHLKQQEQQEILRLQMGAIQSQLKAVVQVKPIKSSIDEKHQIPYYDLVFESPLATGSFGSVYRGQWEGQTVAIKTLEGTLTLREEQQFIREAAIMARLRHPNVTSFYGACLEDGRACLVMEFMEELSLDKCLSTKAVSWEQEKSWALDIAKGMQYLHRQGVLHRDLKSANILVNKIGTAKLADFGLSKIEAASIQTIADRSQCLPWQAPECFQFKSVYTEASDIYSFGVILWEIVTRQVPTLDERRLKDYATLGERQVIPTKTPAALSALIKNCWAVEPTQRPTLENIIQQLENYQARPASPSAETYYQQGQRFEKQKDFLQAFTNYQKSADKGYTRAKTNLGHFYLTGPAPVLPDKSQAFRLFLEAAHEGHTRAMFNTATMLEYGDGVTKNKQEALTWYRKVCQAEPANLDAARKCEKLQGGLKSIQN